MRSRVLVSVFLVFTACTPASRSSQQGDIKDALPAFKLTAIDGSVVDSSRLQGKVTLLNFWATWCAPCRLETPWLVEFKKQYQDRGFEIVGIALDPENKKEIADFAREFQVNYPLVYADGNLEKAVGGFLGVPTTCIFDRSGNLVKKHEGIINKDILAREIESLL